MGARGTTSKIHTAVTKQQSLELSIAYFPDPKEKPESKIQSLKPRA